MRGSLEKYGHDLPELFYTDNMSDKEFLEKCFPSLRQNVVLVEKYAHLEEISIPSDVTISVLSSVSAIDDAMQTIIQLLPPQDSVQLKFIVIGVDSEWNVEISEQGYVTGRGQMAILQLAVDDHIFILQVCFSPFFLMLDLNILLGWENACRSDTSYSATASPFKSTDLENRSSGVK